MDSVRIISSSKSSRTSEVNRGWPSRENELKGQASKQKLTKSSKIGSFSKPSIQRRTLEVPDSVPAAFVRRPGVESERITSQKRNIGRRIFFVAFRILWQYHQFDSSPELPSEQRD